MELLPRPPTPVFPELRPPSPGEMTFGLKSLFVVMTMLSVLLGIVAAVPGCGVPLAVLALPAWIRTSQEFSERRRRGCGEYTFVEMAMTFVAYVMLAGVCVVTVAAAFLVPCFLPMIVASAVFEGGGVPVAFATLFGIALSLVTTFLTARMCYREIWRSRL
jgi:hypothetical protein